VNLVFLNGRIVPGAEARVSVFDRGFLYGDGVFETLRVQAGKPFRWESHQARLESGLRLLGLASTQHGTVLAQQAAELIAANQCQEGVLRVTVSRGPGVRGYSPAGADTPTVVMSLHPRSSAVPAAGLRLVTATLRVLAADPLAAVKSTSRLLYVLARAEADTVGADDALLLNQRDEVSETTSANVFLLDGDVIHTPELATGLLAGVARGVVVEIATEMSLSVRESAIHPKAFLDAEGVFVANVVSGPREVGLLDDQAVRRSNRVAEIRRRFEALVARETGGF